MYCTRRGQTRNQRKRQYRKERARETVIQLFDRLRKESIESGRVKESETHIISMW
jgi:hypothetical protein